MGNCSNCLAELELDSSYCWNCGYKNTYEIPIKPRIKENNLEKKGNTILKKSFIYLGVIFCLDLIAIKLLFIFILDNISPFNIDLFSGIDIILLYSFGITLIILSLEFLVLKTLFLSYPDSLSDFNIFMFISLPLIHFVFLIFLFLHTGSYDSRSNIYSFLIFHSYYLIPNSVINVFSETLFFFEVVYLYYRLKIGLNLKIPGNDSNILLNKKQIDKRISE